jgi:hypothetical protein
MSLKYEISFMELQPEDGFKKKPKHVANEIL